MKWLIDFIEAVNEIQITFTGGYAICAIISILCMGVLGLIEAVDYVRGHLKG